MIVIDLISLVKIIINLIVKRKVLLGQLSMIKAHRLSQSPSLYYTILLILREGFLLHFIHRQMAKTRDETV